MTPAFGPTPAPGARRGVVAVTMREDRFLVIQRSAIVSAPLAWCFVGGAIEAGESSATALVREFREEVGGEIAPQRCVWRFTASDGGLHLEWWLATLRSDGLVANPAEVAAIAWLTPEELLALPNLLPTNRVFIETVGAGLLADASWRAAGA